MRVRSPLADIDLELGPIAREGDKLVVRTVEGAGIPTRVDIDARDAVSMLKAIFSSRHALMFLLQLPVLYRRARRNAPDSSNSIEHPWN